MTFKLSLEYHYEDWIGDHSFTIENLCTQSAFKGTLYDYNQIVFLTGFGGISKWLQNYLQLEEPEATHIAEQLHNWHNYIASQNNKE